MGRGGVLAQKNDDAFLTISGEEQLLDRASAVIERALGLHVVRAQASAAPAASIFIHSKLLLGLMDFLGFGINRKRIPGWILGLPLSRLKWFIEGYREGDGVHSGKRFEQPVKHQFVTVSDELKDDLIVALARFGLVPSVGRYSSRIKQKTGDRQYPFWNLTVGNVSPWSPLEWDAGVIQRFKARTPATSCGHRFARWSRSPPRIWSTTSRSPASRTSGQAPECGQKYLRP